MLTTFANLGIKWPKRLLGIAGLVFVLAALFGGKVADHLNSGGFNDTKAPSWVAKQTLQDVFHSGDPNLILEVSSPAGVDSAAAKAAGERVTAALRQSPYAEQVTSYWNLPAAQAANLRSADGTSALVVALIAGDDDTAPKRAEAIYKTLTGTTDGVTVNAGGQLATISTINKLVKSDLTRSEMIAIPLTAIALAWVFGSVVASLLPLIVGLFAIVGTMAGLRVLASFTHVSIYSLNMTTALGLALAIDYSLFIVSRYREELHAGADGADAVRTAMHTAGRTVLFSALTVALSMSALLVFPLYFLRSFAYAGALVVALATLAALLLLPALLTVLGPRVDALDLRALVRRMVGRPPPTPKPVEESFWYRFANSVMRRAVPVATIVVAFLVALGLPFLHAKFGYPDQRVVPSTEATYRVGQDLDTNYDSNAASTVTVVIPDTGTKAAEVGSYAAALSKVQHVTAVRSAEGTYVRGVLAASGDPAMTKDSTSYLDAQINTDTQSDTAKAVLHDLKDVAAPWKVQFTGQTAINADSLHALDSKLPLALLLIALATFVILFLFTGSVVLPLKALVLNVLSLSATFGAMVWVFQEGHLSQYLGNFTATGTLVATMPPLMFCVAFGLSMDYEVFVLSRIREEWLASDRTTEANTRAVALGLGRTGRIVTAAALLMAIVFVAIAFAHVSFMILFGTGLALAVVMDATVVRGILVPALMRIAGRWNWWAPKPLARLHERIGLAESGGTQVARETVSV
jgi:RND superfamily putative drug exporter